MTRRQPEPWTPEWAFLSTEPTPSSSNLADETLATLDQALSDPACEWDPACSKRATALGICRFCGSPWRYLCDDHRVALHQHYQLAICHANKVAHAARPHSLLRWVPIFGAIG